MIKTERLILRQFKTSDAKDLYDYLSKTEIYAFEPGEPIDMEEAVHEAEIRSKGELFIAVESKEDQKLIGHLYFAKNGYDAIRTWYFGYIFNPAFQGKSYCTEACKALLSYAFKELGAHRIEAKCSTENIASNKVLVKLGFRKEGTMLKNVFFHMDEKGLPRWFDSNIYGLLSEEWKG